MKAKELYALTLKERFVNEIETMIISGKLKPGAKLPTQRELSQRMGVSRTVVNMGISQMADKGFLHVRPRVGTFVSNYRQIGSQEILTSILNCNWAVLQQEDKNSINQLCNCFIQLLISFASGNSTTSRFIVLKDLAEKIKFSEKPVEAAQYTYEFYHQLSLWGENTIMPLVFASFKVALINLWEELCREKGIDALYKKTQTVLEYILQDIKASQI